MILGRTRGRFILHLFLGCCVLSGLTLAKVLLQNNQEHEDLIAPSTHQHRRHQRPKQYSRAKKSNNATSVAPPPRYIYRVHKMGHVLVQSLLNTQDNTDNIRIAPIPKKPALQEHRSVVVTRNWYSALISGYLYHRAGHECWLNPVGTSGRAGRQRGRRKRYQGWLLHHTGWKDYTTTIRNTAENLCDFLQKSNEQQGLDVYIPWALDQWYWNVLRYYHENRQRRSNNTTIFVCFEDLADPVTQAATWQRVQKWLDLPKITTTTQPETYQGGHATSKDPVLRTRLHNLIAKYDANGTIAAASNLLGCGPKIEPAP